MNEIGYIEKLILSNIDLQKGPDNIQINLAIKLNIFKIFSLNVRIYLANTEYPSDLELNRTNFDNPPATKKSSFFHFIFVSLNRLFKRNKIYHKMQREKLYNL
jgi:hypothetical protein